MGARRASDPAGHESACPHVPHDWLDDPGAEGGVPAGSAYMSHPTVDHVLELIEQMPEEDRLVLEQRLWQQVEAEWDEAVAENQRLAQERGITEETIDRVIHRRRYGE